MLRRLLVVAVMPLLVATAYAAPAEIADPATTNSPRVVPGRAPAPTAGQAAPVPPGSAAPRRPRPYEQCRQIAFQRHLRGAERRHFMTRCQLGYGRPLFRRRGRPVGGPVPAPVTPPGAVPSQN